MPSEPKTPGQVAWGAYRSALIRTPADFRGLGEAYTSPAWEAAAQAVREQTIDENKRAEDLLSAYVIRDIRVIQDIRKIIKQWRAESHIDNADFWFDYKLHYDFLEDIDRIVESPTPAHERHRADPED